MIILHSTYTTTQCRLSFPYFTLNSPPPPFFFYKKENEFNLETKTGLIFFFNLPSCVEGSSKVTMKTDTDP